MTLSDNKLLRAKVDDFKEAIHQLGLVTFRASEYYSVRARDVSLAILPLDGPEERRPHLITLSRGLPPPVEVQERPCGVVRVETGDLEHVFETDHNGQGIVELAPGNYYVRSVVEVSDQIDAEIIFRLKDPSRLPALEDVLDDPDAPDVLKEHIARLLDPVLDGRVQSRLSESSSVTGASPPKDGNYVLAASTDIASPVDIASPQPCTWGPIVMEFPFTMAAAPKQQPTYAKPSRAEERFGQDGDSIFIRCGIDEIPTGLCRLVVEEKDRTVTVHYPRLKAAGKRWIFRASIADILGRDLKLPRKVTAWIVPATAETAHEFDNESVRDIVSSWPADSEQRKRAERFLAQGTTDE